MPTGLSTSKAAPASDMFLIVQSMATATPNMMEPPLKVRSLGLPRFSIPRDLRFTALQARKVGPMQKVKFDLG